MPGMGTGLNSNDPTVVSAFHAQLVHQGLIVLAILAVLAFAWNFLRSAQLRRAQSGAEPAAGIPAIPEPAARRLLRISFGLIWIFDGILQAQASMPLGMAPQVIRPAAAASPTWVQHVVNAMATIWSYHPIAAPAAAVWIQIGIGAWLLAASRGNWSRLAGLAGVGWGVTVWVFGEAFGQIFAPGLTWLFGAPGAVLFYCVAGVLIALPRRAWATPLLGKLLLRALGVFFVGMALLQAWPGRGFWQGQLAHSASAGTLTGMVQQMAQIPQPHLLSSWVNAFARFDAAHGWGVNLFVVIALTLIGVSFLSARPRLVLIGVLAGAVLCLADWVLIEDLGFLGGVGTDPNSMIPMALLFVSGYLALTRSPRPASENVVAINSTSTLSWRERMRVDPAYAFRSVAALAAVGITVVGAAPMAVAATNPHADPILAQAIDGKPNAVDSRAPGFNLIDQFDRAVSLEALRGKTVALTFLDPVCTSDCPIIAQEFRAADRLLGSDSSRVELVAIDANPRYVTADYLRAFDQQEGLEHVSNWLYLTGSLEQLERVWSSFGAQVQFAPGGAMIAHSEFADVIGSDGRTRYILNTDPGPASEATRSSFSVTLSNAIRSAMGS
ncbi:MAG TPA: SCO family protein [Acidimicrobiales bacterium]|nr:SCO family protein [Acidimicrobiales bacterium]